MSISALSGLVPLGFVVKYLVIISDVLWHGILPPINVTFSEQTENMASPLPSTGAIASMMYREATVATGTDRLYVIRIGFPISALVRSVADVAAFKVGLT